MGAQEVRLGFDAVESDRDRRRVLVAVGLPGPRAAGRSPRPDPALARACEQAAGACRVAREPALEAAEVSATASVADVAVGAYKVLRRSFDAEPREDFPLAVAFIDRQLVDGLGPGAVRSGIRGAARGAS